MIEVKAPGSYNYDKPLIYLAGSIEMGQAEKWQDMVVKSLSSLNVTILNPRRNDWDSSWVQRKTDPRFLEQVQWELKALEDADAILLYFSPKSKAPISLLEMGLYARDEKLWVACPETFYRRGNVEVTCEYYNIPILSTLNELIDWAKMRFDEKECRAEDCHNLFVPRKAKQDLCSDKCYRRIHISPRRFRETPC